MIVVDDNVYVAWASSALMFSRSTDAANNFSEPIKLGEFGRDISPQHMFNIAASGNNVYLVYSNEKDVFLFRSTDRGATFSEPVNVSRMNLEPDSSAILSFPVISVAGDRVYVAWIVGSPSWSGIFFAQSADRGATFGEKVNLASSVTSFGLKIASFDKYAYLAWTDFPESMLQASFAISRDGGKTFESKQNVSRDGTAIEAATIEVAADDKYGYVVWNEGRSGVLTRIAHDESEPDLIKQIAVGGVTGFTVTNGKIYATTAPPEQGIGNVAFVKSLDRGETFSEQKIISNQTWSLHPRDSGPSPVIAANGANVFVAWRYTENSDQGSTHVTYLTASYDRGETFTSPINASKSWGDTDGDSRIMVDAGTNDRLFLLWQTTSLNGSVLWFVKGQIPEEYAAPYREVSPLTPGTSYNMEQQYMSILGIGAAIAGTVAFLTLRKRNKNNKS